MNSLSDDHKRSQKQELLIMADSIHFIKNLQRNLNECLNLSAIQQFKESKTRDICFFYLFPTVSSHHQLIRRVKACSLFLVARKNTYTSMASGIHDSGFSVLVFPHQDSIISIEHDS